MNENTARSETGLTEHEVRLQKAQELVKQGIDPWPANQLTPTATAKQIHDFVHEHPTDEKVYAVAGRIMTIREHGKTIFAHIQDTTGLLQIYLKQDTLGQDAFLRFKQLIDTSDIMWCQGTPFITKMGEITLNVSTYVLLSKSLYPLPEKFHGLSDVETIYRQRYLDLITNPESRARFTTRFAIVALIREYLMAHGCMEVETPMLHPIPGGAVARPFVTHHNALDMELYLRIAPELYLKQLVVGGFERVFEINRSFRNEGISTRHNPEFTMVELYVAYHNYEWMMDLSEDLIRSIVRRVCPQLDVTYGAATIHFEHPFERLTMVDAIKKYLHLTDELIAPNHIDTILKERKLKHDKKNPTYGEKLYLLFDKGVENQLIQPTFITQFPVEVSPLAKSNPDNPAFTDRFEMFIAGMEISNAYNELNNPFIQAERFKEQAAARVEGDSEAHYYDADFIRALEQGLPPTVGFGMGIDRLTMLLTNTQSIRDVILFPTLKRKE